MSAMTRRKFLKRSGGATVAALVACNLVESSLAQTVNGSSSYALICTQEPAEGDWGGALLDVTGAHGGNVGFSMLMGGNRYLAIATAVTNHDHPTFGSRCIRVGTSGRNPDHTVAKVCVAGAFIALVRPASGAATVITLTPKHWVSLTLDPATGFITVSDSGLGHTSPSVAGGAPIVTTSKITTTGDGSKKVTLDVEWSLEWSQFETAQINLVKTWVNFGASASNKLTWKKAARFVFEAVERKDLNAKSQQLHATRIDRVHYWTNEVGQIVPEVSPFGNYQNPGHPVSTLMGVRKLTEMVTEISIGSRQGIWEF